MPSSSVSETIIDIHRHIAHPGFMTNLAPFPRDMFLEEIPDQTKIQKDTIPFSGRGKEPVLGGNHPDLL